MLVPKHISHHIILQQLRLNEKPEFILTKNLLEKDAENHKFSGVANSIVGGGSHTHIILILKISFFLNRLL